MLDVLVADDDAIVRESVAEALQRAGHFVSEAKDGEEALALASRRCFDVAICDVQMPRLDGLTLFRRLRHDAPSTAVIIMTSFGKISDVVGALRDGATDYVTKPFDADDFTERVIGPIAERRAMKRRFEQVRAEYLDRATGARIVAESPTMRGLLDRLDTIAQSDVAVMLSGERSTGKKLLARRLHEQGPRRDGPFIVVPCGTLHAFLLDSERLELERGASSRRHAWFRAAERGTLVLDGVEELPLPAQSALVRVLESAAVARRTADWQPLGVRLVSLASSDVATRVPESFLPTLYFRLSNAAFHVPPLRERTSDLVALTRQILVELTPPGRSVPTIEPAAWTALSRHVFPGNIGELTHVLAHALSLAGTGSIHPQHLPPSVTGSE